jgi:hypothetical protein
VVEHDSIILPGREGKITEEIDLTNAHGGSFKKSVTVISNAANEPSLKLSLAGNILAFINVASQYVRLKCELGKESSVDITMSSQKADLKIQDLTFQEGQGGMRNTQPAPGFSDQWQHSLPEPVKFKTKRAEKPDENGYYEYTITIFRSNPPPTTTAGEFTFLTNHPSKSEIRIKGMIEAPMRKESQKTN